MKENDWKNQDQKLNSFLSSQTPRPPEGKHSPLPWDTDFSGGHADHIYQGTRLVAVAKETQEAALIIQAVNFHAQLVEALKECHEEAHQTCSGQCEYAALLKEATK